MVAPLQQPTGRRLLTAHEAAQLTGRSRSYFYRKIAPHLPFDGDGNEDRRWWEHDVLDFLEKRKRLPGGKRLARRRPNATTTPQLRSV